jgi:hypothetical protein
MGDPGPTPLSVTIKLRSSQFEFPDGDQRDLTLERPNQVATFTVVAKASGQNPILVEVRAPSGRVISEQTMVVRSTALNRVALVITGAAAVMLLALWARRFLRRRTN